MKLIQDLREFIELLNSESVRYLVIGGWAYNRYAAPRVTGDIDFFVSSSSENEIRLRAVLEKFGFAETLPPLSMPLFHKKVIMLGRPPHRIDLIAEIDGVSFEEAWRSREDGKLDGIDVSYISKKCLIKNKKAAGRPKDIADLDGLNQDPV